MFLAACLMASVALANPAFAKEKVTGAAAPTRKRMRRLLIASAAALLRLSSASHRMVGVRGFEPPTPSSRTRCATRLRYTPTWFLRCRGPAYSRPATAQQGCGDPADTLHLTFAGEGRKRPLDRGCSSVGRALQSHCRGREFESHQLHQSAGPPKPAPPRGANLRARPISRSKRLIGAVHAGKRSHPLAR